ncbi:hypothetical protein FDB50_15400 [Clostridium botulinum]|uniref:Uncharacterized protein n=1 Tax=Clostridium botulinum TaxID=1491 RepID=A0A846JYI3_CLOBO|nr:hypothetical protein [Clostridium botulinum]NFN06089.1 hypothetical protein [Clostridium botulinum]NFN36425.1 hypothetical protein [Clostridium botulinum]
MRNLKNIGTITKISEIILKYESDFNDGLNIQYKDNKDEFLKDLINEIKTNGVHELLEYYNFCLGWKNDTNSTFQQRKKLEDLILILEGQIQ